MSPGQAKAKTLETQLKKLFKAWGDEHGQTLAEMTLYEQGSPEFSSQSRVFT